MFCGSPNDGGSYFCVGPNGTVGSTTADPPPDYATFTTKPGRTLAERWDGTTWKIQTTPNPAGASFSQLQGVSCTSATACTAVGYYVNSAGSPVTLAERWDGTTWAIQPTPNPSGGQPPYLEGVSCTSATACTAVGTSVMANVAVTLAERWDGTSWTIEPTPNQSRYSQLSGVSCISATACTAVGTGPIAERWDGTSWTIQPTPNPSSSLSSPLSGVSCASATACTAVGDYLTSGPELTLAEGWDGTAWTIQPNPNPSGAPINTLSGVSCTSATACTAVGSYGSPETIGTQAERWDGTTWTIQTTPSVPHSAGGAGLSSVSCTSTSACEAVGHRTVANNFRHTLAEGWNGTTWSIQTTPPPLGKFATLNGISCTSGTRCTAVGER